MIYQGVRDLPIYYWDEADKTGDLSNILIYNNPITRFYYQKLRPKYLQRRWKQIKDDYIDRIALDPGLKKHLNKKAKLFILKCDIGRASIKRDISKANLLTTRFLILKKEVDAVEEKAKNNIVNMYDQKEVIEKYKGFYLDPKAISVMEFFNSIKKMSIQYREQKKQAERLKGARRK